MAEKEYIERASIYGAVKRHTNPYGKPTLDYESGVKVLEMIKREPAADVVEVRHGEWLPVSDDDQYEGEYHCSRCNAEEFIPDRSPFPPYCWQCGARMDGERK